MANRNLVAGSGWVFALLASLAAAIVATPAGGAEANLGCEGVRIEVNVDEMPLDKYQAYVKEHRCKCLKMQEECVGSAVPPPTPPPVRPPPNVRNFTIYDGRDINGSDYLTLKDTAQEACIERCKQDGQCLAFSWDRWNNFCFLKHRVPSTVRIDPQSMSAVATTERQPSDSNATVAMERFYNAEFRDQAYKVVKELSYLDCERTCKDDACEVFTYETASKACKLIRRPYQYYRLGSRREQHTVADCVASGVRVCSGVRRQPSP